MRGLRLSALRLWTGGVALAFVVLTIGGLTTSSLADAKLSATPGHYAPGLIAGTPRPVRADEYRRSTPWTLGIMARGSDSFGSPLGYPDVALAATSTRDRPGLLLHWEAVAFSLAGAVPDEMLFAAVWWLPVAMVAVLLPLWLTRLGATPAVALSSTALVLLAPVTHWWSMWPLGVLAPSLLAAVLTLAAVTRWERRGVDAVALAALALAALSIARAAVGYAPWAIPLTAAILAPTLAGVLAARRRRLGLLCLAGVVLGGVVLAVAIVAPSGAIEVLGETVYPGTRRSLGTFVGLGLLFGAPHAWILQASPAMVGTNESELATGYLVLGVPCALMALGIRWGAAGRVGAAAAASGLVLAAMATWVIVDWPSFLAVFPLTLIPPDRLAQVLGIPATIAFAFLLTAWSVAPRWPRRPVAIGSAAAVGVLTLLAGRSLRSDSLPTLPVVGIVLASALVALAVLFVLLRPSSPLALGAIPLLALVVVIAANPLQRGFGDLRGSEAAAAVRAAASRLGPGEYLAADGLSVGALLLSNGAPALSGQQWVGPRDEAWRLLDPAGRSRRVWNRGASYVVFDWAAAGAAPRILPLAEDIILVRIDPCHDALRALGLRTIVASRPLTGRCLEELGRFSWGGTERRVYLVGARARPAPYPPAS